MDWRRLCEIFRFSSFDIFPISSGIEEILFLARDRFFMVLNDPMFDGRLDILLFDKSKFLRFPSTYKQSE